MNAAEHTSAPWCAEGRTICTQRDGRGGGFLIADLRTSSLPDDEVMANLALIREAPALLACTGWLVESLAAGGVKPVEDSTDPVENVLFHAQAAFQRATGGAP